MNLVDCFYLFDFIFSLGGERVEHLGSLGYDGSSVFECLWFGGISLIVFLFKMCFWLLKPTSNIPEFHSSTSGYDHWNGSSLGWYFTMYLGQLSEPRCTEIAFVIIMKEEACQIVPKHTNLTVMLCLEAKTWFLFCVLLLVVQTSNLLEVWDFFFEETLMLTRMRFCTLYSEVQDIKVYMEETPWLVLFKMQWWEICLHILNQPISKVYLIISLS